MYLRFEDSVGNFDYFRVTCDHFWCEQCVCEKLNQTGMKRA